MRGNEGQSWATSLSGNYQMVSLERYAALLAAEAERAQVAEVLAAADRFIADSDEQGGPPPEACNACYWTLRAAVRAWHAARAG